MNTLARYRIRVFQPLIKLGKNDALRLEKKICSWFPSMRHDQIPLSTPDPHSNHWSVSSSSPGPGLHHWLRFSGVVHHIQKHILNKTNFMLQIARSIIRVFGKLGTSPTGKHVPPSHPIPKDEGIHNSLHERPLPEPLESHHLPENWQVWKCDRGFTKI